MAPAVLYQFQDLFFSVILHIASQLTHRIPDLYGIVPKEEIAEFEDIMRKIITGIISEASGIATGVYVQKYEKQKTMDEMLQEWKGASQFIIVMDTWFEKLMAE